MGTLEYDDDASRRLLAVYTTPDVVAQREVFARAVSPRVGERVLDIGSGPGFLASILAEAVGPAGSITGVDISEPLNEAARAHCSHQDWVEILHGDAAKLPFASAAADAAIATQVFEYVADLDAAIAEVFRVVRPEGRVVVVDTDWDSIVWHSSDRDRMNEILLAWEKHAPQPRLPRTLAGRLRRAGFSVEAQHIVPLFNPEFNPNTYSNRLIDLIVPFVTGHAGIPIGEANAWAHDLRTSGERGDYFFSLNRYLFIATKP